VGDHWCLHALRSGTKGHLHNLNRCGNPIFCSNLLAQVCCTLPHGGIVDGSHDRAGKPRGRELPLGHRHWSDAQLMNNLAPKRLIGEVVLPEHEAGTRLAQRISTANFVDYLQLGPDLGVVEMQAPAHLHGQTLAGADLRRTYNLTVLALRRNGEFQFNPSGETAIEPGDELLVLGKIHDAEQLSG
jgi:trk system potassium uptake protein TrkA